MAKHIILLFFFSNIISCGNTPYFTTHSYFSGKVSDCVSKTPVSGIKIYIYTRK